MRAILTPDDLKKGELIEVGWHPAQIVDYKEEEAKTDKSTNCLFTFKILDGAEKGKQANTRFNEKALGFGKKLWILLVPGFHPEKGGELSSEVFKSLVGKNVKIYIKRGKSDKGNEFNEVADYLPLQ